MKNIIIAVAQTAISLFLAMLLLVLIAAAFSSFECGDYQEAGGNNKTYNQDDEQWKHS